MQQSVLLHKLQHSFFFSSHLLAAPEGSFTDSNIFIVLTKFAEVKDNRKALSVQRNHWDTKGSASVNQVIQRCLIIQTNIK